MGPDGSRASCSSRNPEPRQNPLGQYDVSSEDEYDQKQTLHRPPSIELCAFAMADALAEKLHVVLPVADTELLMRNGRSRAPVTNLLGRRAPWVLLSPLR
jgi:hypothetical protein